MSQVGDGKDANKWLFFGNDSNGIDASEQAGLTFIVDFAPKVTEHLVARLSAADSHSYTTIVNPNLLNDLLLTLVEVLSLPGEAQ